MQLNLNDTQRHFPELQRPSQDILRAVCPDCGWEREFSLGLNGVIDAFGTPINQGDLNATHSFAQTPPGIDLKMG